MSKYYPIKNNKNSKYNKNSKNNIKKYNKNNKRKIASKKSNSSLSTFIKTGLAILLILGVIAAIIKVIDIPNLKDDNNQETTPKFTNVYLVPSDSWSADGSSYGVWCWNDTGVPASSFVLGTDENEDGVYEFKISKEYTSMLFVDLIPEATELGADWKNKREQTDNLTVPVDDKVYYHHYCSEWAASSDMLFNVTTFDTNVYLDNPAQWAMLQNPVVYYFDKTGKNEPNFIQMNQCGSSQYIASIPSGYTHIIFIDYDVEGSGWDGILNQTSDLIIPVGEANHYDLLTNEWFAPVNE